MQEITKRLHGQNLQAYFDKIPDYKNFHKIG